MHCLTEHDALLRVRVFLLLLSSFRFPLLQLQNDLELRASSGDNPWNKQHSHS